MSKARSITDRAVEWGYLVAAGLSAINLPVDISKYRAGDGGLLPIIGGTSMIIAYGCYKCHPDERYFRGVEYSPLRSVGSQDGARGRGRGTGIPSRPSAQ